MKRTLTINLNNSIFNIDEDAYNELQSYLSSLKNHFSKEEGGDEILSDIEARIAEIFKEKVTEFKQVIVIEDVNYIIETLGRPETIIDEEQPTEEKEEKNTKNREHRNRRMYRDTDNRVIGGVCSGIGAYFNIDPVFVRVLMAVTFFFAGPLIYLLLWIAIPAAKTTSQKLEMKGEKINVSNIEKSIREELNDVKDNFKKYKNTKGYEEGRNIFMQIFDAIFLIISYIFKFIGGILGFVFIIVGLALLFAFSGSFIFADWGVTNVSFPELLSVFADKSSVTIGSIGFFLLIGIPVISIIYGGIKILFNIKTNNKIIGLTLFFFWFLGLILFAAIMIFEGTNFSSKESDISKYNIEELKSDTIYIDLNKKYSFEEEDYIVSGDNFNIINNEGVLKVASSPKLIIQENENDFIELVVKKRAHGKNKAIALENASSIDYQWSAKDSIITFDNYFMIDENKKYRGQDVKLILKVPAGKTIFTKNNTKLLLNKTYYYDENDILIEDLLDEFYIMGKKVQID